MLVLLDNARDSSQVVPLLPGSPTCAVLVTSRHTLAGLVTAHGARPLLLDTLTGTEARQLLTHQLGPERMAADPEPVGALISHCAGLPLALGVVAARAMIHPELPLAALAKELRDTSTRLDALDAGELAVNLRAVLSSSCDALGPDAAQVFALLGLAPGPDISLAAVASLINRPAPRARALVGELINANLVHEDTPGRYRMHDLVRLYAGERARDPEDRWQMATHRVLDHYLHTAYAANEALSPNRDAIPLAPPQPGVVPEPITDHATALAWFTVEQRVLVPAVDHAAQTGSDRHAWQLAWTLIMFFNRRQHWLDLTGTQRTALRAGSGRRCPTTSGRWSCTRRRETGWDWPTRSTRSAGTWPTWASTSGHWATASGHSPSTRSSATVTDRRSPGTASAMPGTTSGTTRPPSTAISGHWT
jgi:hypothetical protein